MAELDQDMDISEPAASRSPMRGPAAERVGPLRAASAPVRVMWLRGTDMAAEDRVAPHRHDYHELVWIRQGSGRHTLDGEPVAAGAGTITVIGRGQIHRFDEARAIAGAVVDFTDEALFEDRAPGHDARPGGPLAPAWLIFSGTTRTVDVPASRADGLQALLHSLDDEARRPPDEHSVELQRHFLCALLLWIDRWHEDSSPREGLGGDARLHVRFLRQLERDFVDHHDAAHYAEALAVPPAALAHSLHTVTGRGTKELVLDRVMLEAARLLRFTDLSIGEIAYRVGYHDPLYFSRAFKRHDGRSPAHYRSSVRGV